MVKRIHIDKTRAAMLLLVMLMSLKSWSQSVTYWHHEDWLQQFMVKETGLGVLTPDLWYTWFHPVYKKTAHATNKAIFRSELGAMKMGQIEMSAQIDTVMKKRAEEEAWNMADRMSASVGLDLAWNTEKDKIEEQLRLLQSQTNDIVPSGGTYEERLEYVAIYNSVNCAINAARDSYQPTSKRKEAYQGIYKDLCKYNIELSQHLLKCKALSQIKSLQRGTGKIKKPSVGQITLGAMERWRNVVIETSQAN